ncbi:MAG: hypothetical protein I3273_02105 [Candidatus Moeniiplasma glomeromycotorum]|nr:hypothetical protein [Candidatus Moeniiplasma glomeromycotorum]MCE8167087.1 hypothetical protein [Candidatus Moeniiplasma glomeromycotorum]MCE8168901.1 hypothetical protein [Candidatus Moeniiplasma glomeromycotorum]
MSRSPRYQKVKAEISLHKPYSLPESLSFLQQNNFEKIKNIKVSFSLNQSKQKNTVTLKSKIILPYPLSSKGKIVVVKDELPAKVVKELAKKKEVELLSAKEVYSRIITEKTGKIKKNNQWGFEKLLIHPHSEKNFKENLPPKLLGLIFRKVLLTENILEAVNNFQQGEQEIRTDKGGNIHALIGKSDYSSEQLEKNYQTLYNEVNKLRPAKWKGNFLKKITLSTNMGPGVRVYV